FRTTDEQVEPGSIISATGDLQSLIDKFLELKERAKTESPKQVFKEDDDDDAKEDRSDNAGDYGSAGSTTAAGGSSGENPLLSDSSGELNENKISSSWEDCEPRVSTADGVVYRQARQIETGEDGIIVNVGDCVDKGSVPIQKIWDECPMIFDFANRKAYEQYTEFAQLDNEKIMVTNCTNDFSKANTIYAKKSNCTTRHDLDAGQSYPQEKLFYTDSSGLEQVLTDCQDADKSYKIVMSSMTCSPQVDQNTKTVTVYKRPAFYLDNGTIEYAGACQAVEQKDIQKVYEGCPVIYDYDAKKVYEQYREFVAIDGKEMEITACDADPLKTYDIYSKPSGCSLRHDLSTGQSYVQEKLFYTDSSGLEQALTDCIDADKSYKIFMSSMTCSPQIDQNTKTVTVYKRPAYLLDNGTIQYAGECQAVEQKDIQKTYDDCPVIYDYDAKKVYEQYREFVAIDGKEMEITACDTDPAKTYDIYSKPSGCSLRYDLNAGKSYVQEKFFYTDSNGLEQVLTDCQDTDKSYTIFMSPMTCSSKVDQSTKTVTVYKRPAFYLDNGTIEYAGDCQAVEQKDIQKVYEGCPIIYDYDDKKVYEQYREFVVIDDKEIEITACDTDPARTYNIYSKPSVCSIRHDLDAGKSYVQEDFYYQGSDGVERKLKECQDSGVSYDHFLTEDTCTLGIDRENGKVTQFKRLAYKKPDGTTEYLNECQPVGLFPLDKTYGEPCAVILDFENKKAYEQYREAVTLEDEVRSIADCTNDFINFYEIYGKTSKCEIRDDFTVGKSYVQEELYYTGSDDNDIRISECQDSELSYDHFSTELTCTPNIDLANDKITTFKRVAYYLQSGEIGYASECRAVDDGSYKILEDFCDPKYEHNVITGQSYYITRDYYIKDATPIYLSDCLVSTSTSFPHIFNSGGCGLIHDDNALRSIQKTSTHIEPPEGKVEISPCQDKGVSIPYIYIGTDNRTKEFTASGTWTVPVGVTSVNVFLVSGGGSGGNGANSGSGSKGAGNNGGQGGYTMSVDQGGAGGGAGGGEQVQTSISVVPGQIIKITIGQSDQNTTFGSLATARAGYGDSYNGQKGGDAYNGPQTGAGASQSPCVNPGDGGNGYGSVKLAQDSSLSGVPGDYHQYKGIGGIGYGAGGAGGYGKYQTFGATSGGKGAPGYAKITWGAAKYKRSDDTIYIQE
ncbi:MAG: hypothetical protein GY718_14045, partial [Lentisphaerae bacterium]|nr:hypothetical protein [Lentisphaerota bacterium]